MKLLFVFAALLVVAAIADPWSSCGTASDHLKINSITITPQQLVPGQQFTVAFDGTMDESVTSGSIHIEVKYIGIKIFEHTYDICSFTSEVKCPIASGPFTMTETETFPTGVPKGKYTGQIKLVDQNQQEITCINFDVKVTISEDDFVLRDSLIEEINARGSWKAARSPRFEHVTFREALGMLGSLKKPSFVPKIQLHAGDIPDSFDSRTQWPGCIHDILDQGQCGSCWAFGATEAVSDRFCIASKGADKFVLSPQYLVSCDNTDYGCEGGYLDNAWEFVENNGLCTDTCFPYQSGSGDVPPCPTQCADGSPMTLYKINNIQQIADAASMQTAIMNGGPVEAAFEVYEDFFSYSSGVYSHQSGQMVGGHAIKILGWGVDSGTPYWICANSWGNSWGMSGFFWILRGSDECQIEDNVICGDPQI